MLHPYSVPSLPAQPAGDHAAMSLQQYKQLFKQFSDVDIKKLAIILVVSSMGLISQTAWAQAASSAGTVATPAALPAVTPEALSINDWLLRMHESAMRKRSYVGTLVQSSPQAISSARIWHACDGAQQIERVETLTGAPRSTFRHNNKVITFMPETKVARIEKREQLGGFPDLLKPGAGSIPEFYTLKTLGVERVAGFEADMVLLAPKDALRFGYRIWTEKKSNLVLKLQTLEANGVVLEQAAFSELQLDAPVKMEKLAQMMSATEGYKVDQSAITKTNASAEGWNLKSPVAGFKPLSCYKRGIANNTGNSNLAANTGSANVGSASSASAATSPQDGTTLQWIFSDGLATVSLFVENYDAARHTQEGMMAQGATHSLFKRMNEFWLTAVGEVPPQTLKAFAQGLERRR
jgi:sigma-E factor negative regulatory protein RseB